MRTIGSGDRGAARQMLISSPQLATARLVGGASRAEAQHYFLESFGVYLYAGHTCLHVAAAAYDTELARALVDAGADVRAKNRRKAEPIHEAVTGQPGSPSWDPARQATVIGYLLDAGADPEALAAGGVTPLHRAVRNRCTAAVRVLLDAGADPQRPNDSGSTAATLARLTTGRSGSGSDAAHAEQAAIIAILDAAIDEATGGSGSP